MPRYRKRGGVTQAKVHNVWIPWGSYLKGSQNQRDKLLEEYTVSAPGIESHIQEALVAALGGDYPEALLMSLEIAQDASDEDLFIINEYIAEDPEHSFPVEIHIRYDPVNGDYTIEKYEVRGDKNKTLQSTLEQELNI
jgi:hypothetical protein